MKVLKYIVFIFAAFCAVSFLFPKDIEVSRSIDIDQDIEFVFDQVNTLKNWESWSGWKELDTLASLEYSSKESGKGAWQTWNSPTAGERKITIVKSIANKQIETSIDFYEQGRDSGKWAFSHKNGTTTVSWTYHVNMGYNPLARWIGLFIKDSLEQSLQISLEKLKEICQEKSLEQTLENA